MWTATVTSKLRDPASFNIVVSIEFSDGKSTLQDRLAGTGLTDAQIAEHCRKRIRNVLEAGSESAVTLGPVVIPADPVIDSKPNDMRVVSEKLQKLELRKRAQAVADLDPTLPSELAAALAKV